MKPPALRLVVSVFSFLLLLAISPLTFAQTIVVTSANPNNGPEGAVNLHVLINGKGFKSGAISKFFISGTMDPGGITVNSTKFVSSSQLDATINIAATSPPTSFDIVVAFTDGRSGKGTKLFAVTVPDPAIAYIVGSVFNGDLMVMNANGTSVMPLLKEDRLNEYSAPSWSPDGSQLVYVNDDGFYLGWLYLIQKNGSEPRRLIALADYAFAEPAWSPFPLPDGEYKILFSDQTGAQHDIFLTNLDGTGLTNLTRTPTTEFFPTWNPTSTRFAALVYNELLERGIIVYDIAWVDGVYSATPSMNLTAEGPLKGADVTEPSWAKNHDKILVSARLPGASSWDLWVIDLADPINPLRVSTYANSIPFMADWSTDDSKIVYRQNIPKGKLTDNGIFVSAVNTDGTMAPGVKLADGFHPDWRRCCPTCLKACAP